jgi:hypothetical protein
VQAMVSKQHFRIGAVAPQFLEIEKHRVLSAKLRNRKIVFPARCDSPSVMGNRREERFVPRFPGSSMASTPRA